jgi:hypothetical protein
VYDTPLTVLSTTTVTFFAVDVLGNAEQPNSAVIQVDQAAPTTTISCNAAPCSSGWYGAPVQVALTATDSGGSGVNQYYYTTDGSTPTTSSPIYNAPLSVPATTTVTYFAVDNAGNAEQPNTVLIKVDQAPPASTISCNSAACSSGWYRGPVQVALAASDSNGSGVDKIYYTTDGSTPSTSSTVFANPFTVSSTTTVRFFAVDVLGNAEQPNSAAIQIDQAAPTTVIRCNGSPCSTAWYGATVRVALSAADSGGSGVSKIYYTTDGSTPSTSSPVYLTQLSLLTTTTVKYFAVDNAGNAERVKTQVINVDQTPPVTTIKCNTAACSDGWYRAPVQVALTATDTGGTGVNKIYYTTNGSTPTRSSPAYTKPFNVSSTTTVKFFAVDKGGNAEAVNSQLIRIDRTAPTMSLTSPANGSRAAQGTTVKITANAVDHGTGSGAASGIASVTFYLDGSTLLGTVTTSPYTFNWSTRGVTKAKHKLTAVATDVAGNSVTSAAITVTIF